MFQFGPDGFEFGLSAEKYISITGTSRATATRDLQDMVDKGIFFRTGELKSKPNIPIAIIEAKDNNHSVSAGIQQALEYARILDIPCVFSSNGDGFIFHDRTATGTAIETELTFR